MATPEETAEKLARYRAEKAKREARAAEEADAAELARFELVERLEKELGGLEGRAFAVVDVTDLGEGLIALKLGDAVLYKAFSESKVTVMDVAAFVSPCVVHPSLDEYKGIAMRRPAIAIRCATALSALYGVKLGDDQKK